MLLALTLLVCFVFAELFERRLHTWRAMLRWGLRWGWQKKGGGNC
ncbi:hypothetical protein MCP1_1700002 [Candidatus Terasakiella magnetica]|nr:hypothetical protein MCP1_1700002 [Candidatus Terasakiella magnetica]